MDEEASATLGDRYGRPAERGRIVSVAVLVLLVAAAIGWALWAGLSSGSKDVTWRVDRFDTHDSDVVIGFTLTRRGDFPVICTFKARGRDGAVVGQGTQEIPVGGPPTVSSEYTLTTSAPPVTGEIADCVRSDGR